VAQIAARIKSAGFLYSPNEPDIGIVVGGDVVEDCQSYSIDI